MVNNGIFHKDITLTVILDENLEIIYFNKYTKFKVENIIKNLEIRNYIQNNNNNFKILENLNFKISTCISNNIQIFVIEIEVDSMVNLKSENIDNTNIEIDIEKLKDKLNFLMKNDYKNNYEKVLEVSMELDEVINKYYMLKRKY